MKKLIFTLMFFCLFAGCAETDEQKDSMKARAAGDIGLPVKVWVQDDKGLPVELRIKDDEGIPVELQVKDKEPMPVKAQVEGPIKVEGQDGGAPVKVDVRAKRQLPVEVTTKDGEALPVRLQVPDDGTLPLEVKITGKEAIVVKLQDEDGKAEPFKVQVDTPREIPVTVDVQDGRGLPVKVEVSRTTLGTIAAVAVGTIVIVFLAFFTARAAVTSAKAAQRSAEATKSAAQGRIFFEQISGYAPKELYHDLLKLIKWEKTEQGEDLADKAARWKQKLDADDKEAVKVDLASQRVKFYFATVLRLERLGYMKKHFLQEYDIGGTKKALAIVLSLEKEKDTTDGKRVYQKIEEDFAELVKALGDL